MQHRVLTAAAVVAGSVALAVPAAAQADQTLTFKESDKGASFHFVDNAPKSKHHSVSAGDEFLIQSSLVSNSGKRIGSLRAECTFVKSSKTDNAPSICFGVFSLPKGQLDAVVTQSNPNAKTTAGAIVGGTGSYAGARGSFVSKSTKTGGNDTVTLLG